MKTTQLNKDSCLSNRQTRMDSPASGKVLTGQTGQVAPLSAEDRSHTRSLNVNRGEDIIEQKQLLNEVLIAAIIESEPLAINLPKVLAGDVRGWCLKRIPFDWSAAKLCSDIKPNIMIVEVANHFDVALRICRTIHSTSVNLPIIAVVPGCVPGLIMSCLLAGAVGCVSLPLTSEDLRGATAAALNGCPFLNETALKYLVEDLNKAGLSLNRHRLTSREAQIIDLIAYGLNDKEISWHLKISPSTVRVLLARSFKKLKARNRREAMNRIFYSID